jgi:hypothetical protein
MIKRLLFLIILAYTVRVCKALDTDQYMTHYWPICNGKMYDEIGFAHMSQGSLTNFTRNRYGCPNSALNLNGGWTQVPSGIYFDKTEFTIAAWVFPFNLGANSTLIDFGNGVSLDNVILALSNEILFLKPTLEIYSGSMQIIKVTSNTSLVLNKWQFIAATFNGTNARIYLNGTLTADLYQSYNMKTLTRSKCYIGNSIGSSMSLVDDLRFYSKSLDGTEIRKIMGLNITGWLYFIYKLIHF